MPIPTVKEKERSRTKSGRWRKKRSDVGKKRKNENLLQRVLMGYEKMQHRSRKEIWDAFKEDPLTERIIIELLLDIRDLLQSKEL